MKIWDIICCFSLKSYVYLRCYLSKKKSSFQENVQFSLFCISDNCIKSIMSQVFVEGLFRWKLFRFPYFEFCTIKCKTFFACITYSFFYALFKVLYKKYLKMTSKSNTMKLAKICLSTNVQQFFLMHTLLFSLYIYVCQPSVHLQRLWKK